MKKQLCFLLLTLICSSCGAITSSEENTTVSTTEVGEKENILVEKTFSSADDSIDFFQSGWMTGNSKFSDYSLRLIDDETNETGAGMVRTPTFENVNKGEVTLIFQPSGFNNATNREMFVDKTFSFAVDFLLKENDEYTIKETQKYEHKITANDAELGYFSDLKPYTKNKEEANKMIFSIDNQDFNCARVRYISKPYYISGTTKQGMNLEIFYLQVKTMSV